VTYVKPIYGVTAGVLFLQEVLDWRLLLGGLLIISGVVAVNWRPRSG
jgi:drug/metabolite transporter (DMT)-like permease